MEGDMKIIQRENDREYLFRRSVLVMIVACIAMGVACYRYYHQIQDTLLEENQHYLSELAKRITSNATKSINDNFAVLDTLQAVLSDSEATSFSEIESLIEKQRDYWTYENIYLVDEAGLAYDVNGNRVNITGDSFLRRLSNEQREMIPAQIINNQECVLFTIPLSNINVDDKHMVALMTSYRPETFTQILSMTSFNEQAYSCIVNLDGKMLIRSSSEYTQKFGYNILQSIREGDKSSNIAVDQLEGAMANAESGQITYTIHDNEEMLVYIPMDHEDWYLFMFVPVSVVNAKSQILLQSTLFISFFLVLLFAALILMLMVSFSRNKRKLEQIAYIDPITKGNTIQRFNERVKTLLNNEKYSYAVVYINIQKFKVLNDQIGRQACDQLLQCMDIAITKNIDEHESYGHYSADNFVVLLEYYNNEEIVKRLSTCYAEVHRYAEQMQLSLPQFILEFGIYCIEDYTMTLQDLIDRSAFALQSERYLKAYDDNMCYAFYNDEARHQLLFEKHLEDMMDKALKEEEFQMFLQPKYRIEKDNIGGAEALVRWYSKSEGMIFPDKFISLFEKNGFIIKLDLWMFEQVCKHLQKWQDEGRSLVKISVNCSRVHLKDPNFLDAYLEIFNRYQIPAEYIELELTENMVFEDSEQLTKVIDDIHALGFGCSMDDFGSGYSSLNLIQDIHVDTLKLDRIFFKEKFEPDKRTEAIIDCILKMARSLSMSTVAEGVEDWDQVTILKKLGCDYVQGYVYAKPMPVSEFEALLFKK